MIGIATRYKARLVVIIFGVLVVVASREADLVLAASRCVLIAMVIVFLVTFEPQFTEVASRPLGPGLRARASGRA